jgi:methionine-rich copper-binding protein CopC
MHVKRGEIVFGSYTHMKAVGAGWGSLMVDFTRAALGLMSAVAVVACSATPVSAHAALVSANPPRDATVAPLRTVQLTFSAHIETRFSTVEIVTPSGQKVAGESAVSADNRTLTATLARPLAPGPYRVEWRIVSADGHRMQGDYGFTVR